jgi:hypothetical protein
MRIRIVRRPTETCIDGIRLDLYEPGYEYDVGHSLAALLLAEGWAEPVVHETSTWLAAVPGVPPSDSAPPNLIREYCPPYSDTLGVAIAFDRRKRDPR